MNQIPSSSSREEWRKYLQTELNAYQNDVVALGQTVQDAMRECWVERIGPVRLDAMFKDRESAERALFDPDPTLRDVALGVLAYRWHRGRHLAEKCEELALSDPDDSVRSTAIHCLSLCYENTSDSRVGRLMAQIVRDDSQAVKVRAAAYGALFHVRGEPPDRRPTSFSGQLPGTTVGFPEYVDWSFVDGFLPPAS